MNQKIEKVEEILSGGPKLGRKGHGTYTRIVQKHYEKIVNLRDKKGYSLQQICEAFAQAKVTAEDINPSSFRHALLRERLRRGREKELLSPVHGDKAPAIDVTEKDRTRKMPNVKVKTGFTEIKKNADGTFDY
jgi:hypothetical protein